MVFVASKNSVPRQQRGLAYNVAKAAERTCPCLAEEAGRTAIRANTVLPDAVIQAAASGTANGGRRAPPITAIRRRAGRVYRAANTLKDDWLPETWPKPTHSWSGPAAPRLPSHV